MSSAESYPTHTKPNERVNGFESAEAFCNVTIDGVEVDRVNDFVERTAPVLERALIARFGVPAGCDAAAAALEYALHNWQRISVMENPAGYLFRVGSTHARRDIRRAGKHTILAAEPSTTDRPVDVDLQRALMHLKWEQRVSLLLVHAHGHSYASASEILRIPVTSITNHLNRGLVQLRRLLEDK